MSAIGQEIGSAPRTHDCPECEGIIPAEAVKIGRWQLVTPAHGPVYERRSLAIKCPHCGWEKSRFEIRPF